MSKTDDNRHVLFNGTMVPVKHFRSWVYDQNGQKCLAESWPHYQELTATGLWFNSPDDAKVAPKKRGRPKKSGDDNECLKSKNL